jgi:hypothetical protein
MMDDLLNIELRLLLLRHGRRNVLKALATITDQTPEQIETELALAEKRKASGKRNTISTVELVGQLSREKPESADMLRTLATRFENRTFLPHLRDVQRFFDRTGYSHGRLRSRREAARQVLRMLSQLGVEELKRLVASPEAQGDSDYALLARQIMGARAKERGPA